MMSIYFVNKYFCVRPTLNLKRRRRNPQTPNLKTLNPRAYLEGE